MLLQVAGHDGEMWESDFSPPSAQASLVIAGASRATGTYYYLDKPSTNRLRNLPEEKTACSVPPLCLGRGVGILSTTHS